MQGAYMNHGRKPSMAQLVNVVMWRTSMQMAVKPARVDALNEGVCVALREFGIPALCFDVGVHPAVMCTRPTKRLKRCTSGSNRPGLSEQVPLRLAALAS